MSSWIDMKPTPPDEVLPKLFYRRARSAGRSSPLREPLLIA